MYRINLYPEYESRRRTLRLRAASTAFLFSLLGLEALLVGAIALSGNLLGERIDDLEQNVTRLQTRLATETRERPELRLALDRLEIRASRMDWSPKLVALSDHIGEDLALAELQGRAGGRRDKASLVVSGRYRDERATIETVSAYLARLREDPRLNDAFDDISLGNIRGDGRGEFDLLCTREESETR